MYRFSCQVVSTLTLITNLVTFVPEIKYYKQEKYQQQQMAIDLERIK